jgi:iron complex outermembrane receptor protein
MFADTSFTVGSYNFYEPAMGLGAPLNKSKTVYARLNALYRHQESFVHFVDKERAFLAPALTWEIGPDTVLTVLTQYVHDWDKLGFPLPAKGMVLPNINGDIPINRFVGERNDSNEVEQWRARVGYQFTHQFNQTFSLRQNLSVSRLWQKKCFTAGARLGPDCCLHLQRREDYQRQHPARRRSPARRARVRLQCMDEIHAAE